MPLKREHLVAWRVNWKPKSDNLRSLAAELDLGIDSFIMLDDSPVECAEIQASCAEVLALQLPPEPERIGPFLSRVWAFDHLKTTSEDKHRTELYRANLQRASSRAAAPTMEEFLKSLKLRVTIAPVAPEQLERAAQLTLRTNQFNVSGLRRNRSELHKLLESGERQCLVVDLSDRFGDYGLVGVVIYGTSPEALVVDTFLLSCRALGKKVEHRMLSALGEKAIALGLGRLDVPFVPSTKNRPALDFLQSFGPRFKQTSGASSARF